MSLSCERLRRILLVSLTGGKLLRLSLTSALTSACIMSSCRRLLLLLLLYSLAAESRRRQSIELPDASS